MSPIEQILFNAKDNLAQRAGAGWNNVVLQFGRNAEPMLNASDDEIMRYYDGLVNNYATPDALRYVEQRINTASQDPDRPRSIFSQNGEYRRQAIKRLGLGKYQDYLDIPKEGSVGKIIQGLINQPITGEYSGA